MTSPTEAFSLVSQRKEQLRKVFTEFEAKKFSLGRIGATWKDIEEHFKEIETCLEKTHEAYTAKEKAFTDRMKAVQAELNKRDADVSAKEQASVRRVQSQKDAAVAAILEQKRKLADDKRRWEAEKQRTETADANTASSRKEIRVENRKEIRVEKALDTDKTPAKMDMVAKNDTTSSEKTKHETPAKTNKASVSLPNAGGAVSHDENKSGGKEFHVEPRPQMKSVCQNMDSAGFKKLILENQKELKLLQDEVPSALRLCSDPAQLVLKTLERYLDIEKTGKQDFSKDDCFVCIMLLEALREVQGENPIIPEKLKKTAKDFGDKWKASLKLEGDIAYNLILIGWGFLQFVVAFGLSNEYNRDEICDIVVKVARRKHAPALLRSLGLSDKTSDVIERLIKDGKSTQAVAFACEFDLLEKFPPAPLLKAHIKEARKAAKTIAKNGSKTLAAQNEALQKELSALKAVANVVKDYKLEGYYTLDFVDKQITNLEKTKVDRKRLATASKAQQQASKKSRTDGGSPGGGRSATPSPERPQYRMHDRGLYEGAGLYGAAGIPDYDRRPLGEFDRRPLEEFDRSLGLYASGYGRSAANPTPYGLPLLGLSSLSRGGQPSSLSGYNYAPSMSSGMGGFNPYR